MKDENQNASLSPSLRTTVTASLVLSILGFLAGFAVGGKWSNDALGSSGQSSAESPVIARSPQNSDWMRYGKKLESGTVEVVSRIVKRCVFLNDHLELYLDGDFDREFVIVYPKVKNGVTVVVVDDDGKVLYFD